MLTIQGIYGREMYETWYKMTVMLQSGLDITPAITHRFPFREHEAAFATARSGDSGKVILDWTAGTSARRPRHDRDTPQPARLPRRRARGLRERHLYRPLRVMSSRAGPDRVDRRAARDQPLARTTTSGLTPPPADEAGGDRGRRDVRRGLGRRADDRRDDDPPRGARGGPRRRSSTPRPCSRFQSGFTANTGVIPTITGETDLIVSDELNHASIIDGMRLSKAPRKVFQHADVDGAARGPARGTRDGPRRHGEPYRLILVVTDGVFSMDGDIAPLPGIVDAAEALRGGRDGRRRPRARACWARTGAGSVNHFGLDGPGRGPGRARCRRRSACSAATSPGSQSLRDILIQRARPFLFSTSPSARRRRRLPRGDPDHAGGARAHRAPVGQHPPVQGGARRASASTSARPRRRSRP